MIMRGAAASAVCGDVHKPEHRRLVLSRHSGAIQPTRSIRVASLQTHPS
jgi:hypothetical protein